MYGILLHIICYALNVCVPSNSCIEVLTPMITFGGGAIGRWLDHKCRSLMNKTSVHLEENLK